MLYNKKEHVLVSYYIRVVMLYVRHMFKIEQNRTCYKTCVMLCNITCVVKLCYITYVMSCYITCLVMLYNMCHGMLYTMCHVMLYNMCHVMLYNMSCYYITYHVSWYFI